MIATLAGLAFLRPHWLWGLCALPVLAWAWWRRRRRADVWRGAVDAHLLPHLLEARAARRGLAGLAALLCGWTLAVLAMAGPGWRSGDAPQVQAGWPLVIALDLSSAALAADLPPSRLLQARAKIATLLARRGGGETGLLAFADDAFTVAPLTADAGNVALFLDALAPEIMPVDGHRPDRAIEAAVRLLTQAGQARGDILLLTGDADGAAQAAAARAAAAGFRISVLGLGTEAGVAYRDAAGDIAHARLEAAALRALASAGGGRFVALSPGQADLDALGVLDARGDATAFRDAGLRVLRDAGYWLLPLVLLLALAAFRRGALFAVVLVCAGLPVTGRADTGGGLWQRADQAAHARLRAGMEAYRAQQYAQAVEAWRGLDGAEAAYNRGNALAKAGRYEEALAAYDEALRQRPGMAEAMGNRAAVEAAMRQPSAPPEDGQDPGGQDAGTDAAPEPGQDGGAPDPDSAGQPPSAPSGQPQAAQESADQDDAGDAPPAGAAPPPADADAQAAADAAQRARMQAALEQQDAQAGDTPQAGDIPEDPAAADARERQQAGDAWLRRVPDDPGGLLREKFRLEHARRNGGR